MNSSAGLPGGIVRPRYGCRRVNPTCVLRIAPLGLPTESSNAMPVT